MDLLDLKIFSKGLGGEDVDLTYHTGSGLSYVTCVPKYFSCFS
jgi:hypothetical protein